MFYMSEYKFLINAISIDKSDQVMELRDLVFQGYKIQYQPSFVR